MLLKKLFIFILIFLLIPLTGFSRPGTNRYLYADVGMGYANFKDTGTSPLRYNGIFSETNLGYTSNDSVSDLRIYGDLSFTVATTMNAYGMYHISGGLQASYLRTLNLKDLHKLRLRLGGTLYAGLAASYNESFQNASFNLDNLVCLSLSSQIEHDFKFEEKDKKFLFINYHLPQRTYRVFFRMDLPVILLNGRPEFPYLNPDDLDYFSRRYFLGGYKMGTELGIKRYLKNGNILEIKYDWDMYTSGSKDIYLLEKAAHYLTTSLYFKLN